jgi:hypothetical protein
MRERDIRNQIHLYFLNDLKRINMNKAKGPKRFRGFRDRYLAPMLIVAASFFTMSCNAQLFPTTRSLHEYNNAHIRGSAVEAFSDLRLNTLIHGMIEWIDSARAGLGGTLGIDTLYAINDSLVRYKKNGVNYNFLVKGIYDSRRKVDSVYMINDSVMRVKINGASRDVIIRGTAGGSLSSVPVNLDSIRVAKQSGYLGAFSLTDLGPNDFITKDMLGGEIATIPVTPDNWGLQTAETDSTIDGDGGSPGSALHVNLHVVAGKAYTDSALQAMSLAGGADGIGPVGVIHDSTLLHTGKAGDSLRVNLNIVQSAAQFKKSYDSIVALIIPTTDKFPGITGPDADPLGNSATLLPTSQAVYNAIQSAAISGGTTMTGWLNILNYGGSANGTFSSGTDNSVAINNALAVAVSGSVIFIPTGSYRCLSTITWPTNKRVFLVCYGDLYFGANTGFIVDGSLATTMAWYGTIYGTDQRGGTINYGTQSNAGIYIRNSLNNTFIINQIHGFKDAIRCGGFGGGNQYNHIFFNYLWRNSVGVKMLANGPTTTPRWANSNYFYGGEIIADSGVVFIKDATPGDYFNMNQYNNFGFEGAGNGNPMKVCINADHCINNYWNTGRFEPSASITKLLFTSDVNAMGFYGYYFQDSWLTHPGVNIVISGSIYSNSGILIGNQAYGYNYSATNPYFNERVRIIATKRSPTVAGELSSNIDVDWMVGVNATVTTATNTVAVGIKTVSVNYGAGTATITLPAAASFPDREIKVVDVNAIKSVTIVGSSNTTTLFPGQGATFISNGTTWYDYSAKTTYHIPGLYHAVADANLTVADGDYTASITNMTADRTMTLPDPALYPGRVLVINQKTGNSNTVSLSRSIYFGGTSSPTTSILNDNDYMIQSDGTRWQVIFERL